MTTKVILDNISVEGDTVEVYYNDSGDLEITNSEVGEPLYSLCLSVKELEAAIRILDNAREEEE